MKKDAAETPVKDAGKPAETAVNVWFVVTKNGAVIGEAYHARGKRMTLPKPAAEECVAQGLGVIDGVA
jgi:hypothetical protein